MGYDWEITLSVLCYMIYRSFINYAMLFSVGLQYEHRLDCVGICMILEGAVSLTAFVSCFIITQMLIPSIFVMAIAGGLMFLFSDYYFYKKYAIIHEKT